MYVIGVEDAVSVNLAGTASVTIAAETGDNHTLSFGADVLELMLDHMASLKRHIDKLRTELAHMAGNMA